MNRPATAEGRTSMNYPMPRMRNTYMLGGDASIEDVIKAGRKRHLC
ncbi:MAG: hypothetical protein MZV63_50065 [Marinilabiliales bacterium]|nr:hypothetical protein [Marinilabiliales bacterium]